MKTTFALVCGLAMTAASGLCQQGGRFTSRPDILAFRECMAQPGSVPIPLATNSLNLEILEWQTAVTTSNQPGEFVLRFRQATPVGTILTYEPGEIYFSVNHHWEQIPAGREAGRKLQFVPVSAPVIDGLKFVVPARRLRDKAFQATLPFIALIPPRLVNVAPTATVIASSTNQPAAGVSPQVSNDPSMLVDGVVDPQRNFWFVPHDTNAPPVPDWAVLTWNQPQKLRGLGFFKGVQDAGFGSIGIDVFSGEGDPKTSLTNDASWRFAEGTMIPTGQFRSMQFFILFGAPETRAVRLRTLEGMEQTGMGEVAAFSPVMQATVTNAPSKP